MAPVSERIALLVGLALATSCGRSGLETPDVIDADGGPGSKPNTEPECRVAEECASANACLVPTCAEGRCASVAVVCDDGNPCTNDACDATSGVCTTSPVTLDRDGDGHRAPKFGFRAGEPGACGDDCDDTRAAARPGGIEVCDGCDNDCNGSVDDGAVFVPSNQSDARVSKQEALEALRGGIAWDGQSYLATWGGTFPGDTNEAFIARLSPDGAPTLQTPVLDSPTSAFTGAVIWNGGGYAVVSRRYFFSDTEIYLDRFDAVGAKLPGEPHLTKQGNFMRISTDLLWTGAEHVVVWSERNGNDFSTPFLRARRVDLDGQLLGDEAVLTGPADGAVSPRLARGISSIATAFNADFFQDKRVAMRLYSDDLAPLGPVITLADGDAVDPSIAFASDRYAIAYSKLGESPGDAIWGAVVDESGKILVSEKKLTSGAVFARGASIVSLGDRFLLFWSDDHDGNYEIASEMLSLDLDVIEPRSRITQDAAHSLNPLVALASNGDVGVLFDDDRSGDFQVYFNRLECVGLGH